jgi:hypothetical protein
LNSILWMGESEVLVSIALHEFRLLDLSRLVFMKMKKNILMACYFINTLMVTLVVVTILAVLFRFKGFVDYVFLDETFLLIRLVLTIPILVLWIDNLFILSKNDKSIMRFLLLFFLNELYNPLYFKKILRNNWQ